MNTISVVISEDPDFLKDSGYSPEEIITQAGELEEFFQKVSLNQNPQIRLSKALITTDTDGSFVVEDFVAQIVSRYRKDGDLIVKTADGFSVNVSALVSEYRDAARRALEDN